MGPSDRKTGPIHPISDTMIVSGLLKPFLAILDFFDSYHALATLCKLENLGNLAFLAILTIFGAKSHHFARTASFCSPHKFGVQIGETLAILGLQIYSKPL